jgi:hypothetical protein
MIPPILISFCNVESAAAPLLALYDASAGQMLPLCFPEDVPYIRGITGLAQCERYIYVATQHRKATGHAGPTPREHFLLIFDRSDFALMTSYSFQIAHDIHSLCWLNGNLYVVSSGTDEVVEVRMKGHEVLSEEPFLRFAPHLPRGDMHHLNGICVHDRTLVLSGFGPRDGATWSSASDGFVMDIRRREVMAPNLQQPHTPTSYGSHVAFCESRRMNMGLTGRPMRRQLPGYTRGICVAGDDLFVATSVARTISYSTGSMVANPAPLQEASGRCTITHMHGEDLMMVSAIDVLLPAHEIFDMLPVYDVGNWPVQVKTSFADRSRWQSPAEACLPRNGSLPA